MDRDEFDRIKEEEKAHLRKVRALKQQLREAKRKQGLLGALKGLDTSALDARHEEALRKVTEKNITAEARYDLAMETLDEAAEQERKRAEQAQFEAEQQATAAADLVRQMKAQMLGDAQEHVEAQSGETQQADDSEASDESRSDEAEPHVPTKTIGPASGPAASPAPSDRITDADTPEDTATVRSIGRFGGRRERGDERPRD